MQILSEFPNVATLREKIITAREVINSVSASENCNAAYLAKQLDISQDFAQIIFIHSTSKCSTCMPPIDPIYQYLENKLHGIIIAANCTDIYFDAKKWHVTFCSAKHQFRIDFVDAIYLSVYDTDTNIYKHLFIQHDTHNKIDFATIHEIISTY